MQTVVRGRDDSSPSPRRTLRSPPSCARHWKSSSGTANTCPSTALVSDIGQRLRKNLLGNLMVGGHLRAPVPACIHRRQHSCQSLLSLREISSLDGGNRALHRDGDIDRFVDVGHLHNVHSFLDSLEGGILSLPCNWYINTSVNNCNCGSRLSCVLWSVC